ncbi:MAG: hypothetical protein JW703_05365, partial [Candidatus Diapherotrites archaeon]|nr:hypothetical protein [Candidatus Diapherotrites archaeon]
MNSNQLLEISLRRGAKEARKSVKKVHAVAATKQKEQLRVKTTTTEIIDELKNLSKSIPNLSELDGFSKEMLSASFDEVKLKQASSQLKKAQKLIKRIQITTSKQIFSSDKVEAIKKAVNQFIARTASIIKTLKSNITLIESYKREIKKYPKLDSENPVAILVGYPNTGKSSILARITS